MVDRSWSKKSAIRGARNSLACDVDAIHFYSVNPSIRMDINRQDIEFSPLRLFEAMCRIRTAQEEFQNYLDLGTGSPIDAYFSMNSWFLRDSYC